MALLRVLFVFLISTSNAEAFVDVLELKGVPDFRSIKLQWKGVGSVGGQTSTGAEEGHLGFLISYCEDQAWGKHRCKSKVLSNALDAEVGKGEDGGKDFHLYETTIDGLRIATNYRVEVTQTLDGEDNSRPHRARALDEDLLIQTKEFQARAINCLANSSLVEIETGPHFGGKISVEGSRDSQCATQGNQRSLQSTYFIDVNHRLCGSEMVNTSVTTFLIVQENLPILTHSTRRFMVVCRYVPATFTVRAGVNLPSYTDYENDLVPVGNEVVEVDPSELFDSTDSLFNSRAAMQVGRSLKLSSEEGQKDSQKVAHLVLMVVLIIGAAAGIFCAVYHFVRQSKRNFPRGFLAPQDESLAVECRGDVESVLPDSEATGGCVETPSLSSQPSASSTSADVDKRSSKQQELSDSPHCSEVTSTNDHDARLQTNASIQHVTKITIEGLNSRSEVHSPDNGHSGSETDSLPSMPSFIPADHCQSVSVQNLENIDAVFDETVNSPPENHDEDSGHLPKENSPLNAECDNTDIDPSLSLVSNTNDKHPL